MIININGGNGGGGGGSYTLPIASASVLGGVKVGSGLTIDNAGRLSTSGGTAAEAFKVNVSSFYSGNWTSEDYSALSEMVEYLSGKTELVEAYIDAVSEDEPGVISEAERYSLNYLDSELAVFFYLEDNNSCKLVLNFEDVEQSHTEQIELGVGSGDSNYVIVDSLEDVEDPSEGLMASVRSYSSETSSNKIYISDIEAFSSEHGGIEGYIGHFLYTGSTPSDPNQSALYISSDQFYWDLENDGQWHTRTYDFDGSPVSIEYRTHNEPDGNAWFEYIPAENVTFSCENNVAETAFTSTFWTFGKSYIYRAGEWIELNATYFMGSSDFTDSAFTLDFSQKILNDVERGFAPVIFFTDFNYPLTYNGIDGQRIRFYGSFWNTGCQLDIAKPGWVYDPDGGLQENGIAYWQSVIADTTQNQHTINLTSGGTFDNPDQLGKFSEESHTDIIIFKIDGDYDSWSQAPIKYVYRTRSQEEDPLVYYWSVEIPVNGTLYRGVWHATEGDWSNYTTDSWAAV